MLLKENSYRLRRQTHKTNREFFNASPESAKAILEIAEEMGGKNVTPKEVIAETDQDKQALVKQNEEVELITLVS